MDDDNNLAAQQILLHSVNAELSTELKRILSPYPKLNVVWVKDYKSVESTLNARYFDYIIFDYDLDNSINPQVIFEDFKLREVISYKQIFAYLVHEKNVNLLSSFKHKADKYLLKPCRAEDLIKSIAESLQLKRDSQGILQAIQGKDFTLAIKLADAKLAAKAANSMYYLNLKIQSLMQNQEFGEAQDIIERILKSKENPLYRYYLAQNYFFEKKFKESLAETLKLLSTQPNYLAGTELALECYVALSKSKERQVLLNNALKLCPNHLVWQQQLLDLAIENKDTNLSNSLLKSVIKLGYGSQYLRANDIIYYLSNLIRKSANASGQFNLPILEEALSIINQNQEFFADNEAFQLTLLIYKVSLVSKLSPSNIDTISVLNNIRERLNFDEHLIEPDILFLLANAYLNHQHKLPAEQLFKHIMSKISKTDALALEIEAIALANDFVVSDISLNRKAKKLFETGKVFESIELFETAAHYAPNNPSINLNVAQALLQHMQKVGSNSVDLDKVKLYLTRIQKLDLSEEQHSRRKKLVLIYGKIVSLKIS